MNAVNFDALMLRMLDGAADKRLLLHACCAPCASHCLTETAGRTHVTVFFYNPNLSDEAEYGKRKAEIMRLIGETGWADALDCAYAPEDFAAIAKGYESAAEGGARCERCFRLRLERTAQAAKEGGYDMFGTTLTLSPLKNAALINRIGMETAEKYGVEYLPSDFKKRGGYLHSVRLSEEYCLYRQNYCGCVYSMARLTRHAKGEGAEKTSE